MIAVTDVETCECRGAGVACGTLALSPVVCCPSALRPRGRRLIAQAAPGYRYSVSARSFRASAIFARNGGTTRAICATAAGKRFGFELVFFRQGQRRGPAANPSAWRVDDLYLAHAALTDIERQAILLASERLNRAGPGVAGASVAQRASGTATGRRSGKGERQTLRSHGGRISVSGSI